jgi:hypothetical protein
MASITSDLSGWGSQGTSPPGGYNYLEGEQPVDEWDNYVAYHLIDELHELQTLANDRIETDKGASGSEPGSPETAHLYYDTDNERLEAWDDSTSSWHGLMRVDGDTMQGVLDMGGYAISNVGSLALSGNTDLSGNDLVDGGTTVWDSSNGYIPQSSLQQDSVTVNAGNQLTGGGTVALGNSITINLDEGAGSGLNADQIDGKHYSDIQSWVNNNADVPNADYADSAGDADTVDGEHASAFADSGHLHDGRYVLENGDTMTGRLTIQNTALGLDLSPTNRMRLPKYAGTPSSSTADVWYDTNDDEMKVHDGNDVVSLVGGGGLFSDGSDGAITDSADTTRDGVLTPTTYTLQAGNTVTVGSKGYLIIVASESITIDGSIDANYVGADPSGGNADIVPLGTGGSGGSGSEYAGTDSHGDPGGDGDTNTPFTNRDLVRTGHVDKLMEIIATQTGCAGAAGGDGGYGFSDFVTSKNGGDGSPPGGGGAGGTYGISSSNDNPNVGAAGGTGGQGGGYVILVAPKITITGTITADGEDGTDGTVDTGYDYDTGNVTCSGGGGGGGSGGLIGIMTASLSESGATYSVSKGQGGIGPTGSDIDYEGGDGAPGEDGLVMKIVTN